MPEVTPKFLRPFIFHGVNVQSRKGQKQAEGDCPFCGRYGKFRINTETGQWRCVVCNEGTIKGGGNVYTFLRKFWETCKLPEDNAAKLKEDRKLLAASSLGKWGVRFSYLTGDWLFPGYSPEGSLNQLYRYVQDRESGKMKLLATPGLNHQLHGINLWQADKPRVFVCEGPWDAIALWEVVSNSPKFADANVIAVPGCNTFPASWCPLLAGKIVYLLFDNDHPRELNGKRVEPAGWAGMKRVAKLLQQADVPPKEIRFLEWQKGHDHNPGLKSGCDVRDRIAGVPTLKDRITLVNALVADCQPIPDDWRADKDAKGSDEVNEIECRPCSDWKTLQQAWRKAMKWIPGLDLGLSVSLACVTSTKAVGGVQLWLKLLGPASCGKSTICEALSVSKKYVIAKSTLRGFHSGYDDGSGDNHSPLQSMMDKTLVTKDGDSLYQAPNISQIMSEARDVYDRTSRSSYRTKASKDWHGVNMTWIICCTPAHARTDKAELGERFLDCQIMDRIDDDLEDEIIIRSVHAENADMTMEANGRMETQHSPAMLAAMQLTGGYVEWLRTNANARLREISANNTDEVLLKCGRLGKFVAYMRARPSDFQTESSDREFSSRLVKQLVRLANCLAVVLNRPCIDDDVMARVRSVAMDTARGRTLALTTLMYHTGEEGEQLTTLCRSTGHGEEKERNLLRFMRKIGAVEYHVPVKDGIKLAPRWRLSERMRNLYAEVMIDHA